MRSETVSGTATTAGAKLRIEQTPAATSRSATSWAAAAGVAMIPILMPRSLHDRREVVDRLDRQVADLLADLRRVGVHEGQHPEPTGAEAPVVGQRLAEVAEADDGDRPVRGEPELAR